MRNTDNLILNLSKCKIKYNVHILDGGAIGISHEQRDTKKVRNIAELMGYSFLLPYQYEYSFKHKPKGQTIIF